MSDVSLTQKFANMFTKLGAGLTQTAMTGIALKSMNNGCGNSIWGCGGGYGGFLTEVIAEELTILLV